MEKKREKRTLYVILLVILLAAFGVWMLKIDELSATGVYSDTGVWDLRAMDWQNRYAVLQGNVSEYIPGRLLTPQEFEESDSILGSYGGPEKCMTMRTRLLVPDGQMLGITFYSVPYADRIYINGQWMQDVGTPGASPEESVPGTTTVYYTVMPQNGVIEIVHQVSNHVHREYSNSVGLAIGSLEMASRHYARETFVSALVVGGCFILLGIHLLLFVLWRQFYANLFAGLFCLVYALRLSTTGAKILSILFPRIPWAVCFRIEYVSMPLMAVLVFLTLYSTAPALIQKWALYLFLGVEAVVIALFVFADTIFISTYALYISHGVLLVTACYLLVRFVFQRKNVHFSRLINLTSYFLFLYAVVREMLFYESVLIFPFVQHSLMDYASIVYIMFQTVATYLYTVRQLRQAWHNEEVARFESETLRIKARQKEEFLSTISPNHLISRGPLAMDTLAGRAYLDGEDLLLTPKEFSLLLLLVQYEGELLSAENLYEQVWKQPATSGTRSLVTIISSLRKKLERGGNQFNIAARRGKGYFFEYSAGGHEA